MASVGNGGRLVVSFFDDVEAGRAATEAAHEAVPGGSVGMLVRTHDDVDVARLDPPGRSDPEGLGALLAVLAAAITGGVLPRRHHFFDRRSDLSTDDVRRLSVELEVGHTAVLAWGSRAQAERVVVRLTELGGKVETHRLSRRALSQAAEQARPPGRTDRSA